METEITVHEITEIVVVNVPGPTEQIAVSVVTEEITVSVENFYVGDGGEQQPAPDFTNLFNLILTT